MSENQQSNLEVSQVPTARRICSKFGEDRSVNHVTILVTDAGHRTPDTPNDFIFCPMLLCIAFDRQLLARDSIYAIASYMLSPVRPSVCLCVTRVDQSKTVEVRITQPSPQSSPMTLVSRRLTSRRNSKGKIGNGGAE